MTIRRNYYLDQRGHTWYYVRRIIETECRPSEIANLLPENICLDAEVPHIRIRPTAKKELKSMASARDIPLLGVSLSDELTQIF